MVQRLAFRHRLSYNTNSNHHKVSKTLGGKLVYLYQKKLATTPMRGDYKTKRRGMRSVRPNKLSVLSKWQKTVNLTRACGGSMCHKGKADRERIICAFLVEEQKIVIVARVLKAQEASKKH